MGASCLSPARSKWCRNPSWARRVHIKRRKWRGGADARSPWRVKNIRAESYVLRDKNTRISPVASVLSSFFELMFYFSFIIRLRYYYHYQIGAVHTFTEFGQYQNQRKVPSTYQVIQKSQHRLQPQPVQVVNNVPSYTNTDYRLQVNEDLANLYFSLLWNLLVNWYLRLHSLFSEQYRRRYATDREVAFHEVSEIHLRTSRYLINNSS